jgi:tetratricopeptide (TPR) repeat protein
MDDATLDLLEQHYQHKLTGKALEEFEHRLSVDHEFAAAVETYRQTREAIASHSDNLLRSKLNAIGAQKFDNTQVPHPPKIMSLAVQLSIAASILILLTAGWWIYRSVTYPENPGELFRAYYESAPIDEGTLRGGNQDHAPAWQTALSKYKTRQFEAAAADFESSLADPGFSQRSAANLYLGCCYLETNAVEKAVKCFQQISNESAYEQQAEWYLALAYLKQNDIAAARKELNGIVARSTHYKKTEGAEILNLLN